MLTTARLAALGAAIAFQLVPGSHYGLLLTNENGGGATELTKGEPSPTIAGTYSWSPDGSRLVYAAVFPESRVDLVVIAADGSHATRITSTGGNLDPVWSPNGSAIAFTHTTETVRQGVIRTDRALWTVAPDGSNAHRVGTFQNAAEAPVWSPDGTKLLAAGSTLGVLGGNSLVVVDAHTGATLLRTADEAGAWSPDGSRLALATGSGIDVAATDGSDRRTVAAGGLDPVWSPDGSRIAFVRTHCVHGGGGLCGYNESSVFVVSADGSGEQRLTGPLGGDRTSTLDGFPFDFSSGPVWFPDGRQLLFISTAGGRNRAMAMNADGTCEHPFGPPLGLEHAQFRPGAAVSSQPDRCVDLRVRARPRGPVRPGARAQVDLDVENDGDETATGVALSLRLTNGHGTIGAVPTALGSLAPGAVRHLVVAVSPTAREAAVRLHAHVTAGEPDADPASNTSVAVITVRS